MRYVLPPGQQKLNLLETDPNAVVEQLRSQRGILLDKAIPQLLEGFSGLAGREAATYAARGDDILVEELTDERAQRLLFYLKQLKTALEEGRVAPVIILEKEGRPRDFSCLPVRQYGAAMLIKDYPGCSALLESFFAQRTAAEQLKQRSGDLLTLLANASERVTRRVAIQKEELEHCRGRESLKQKGDLVSANLYTVRKGDGSVEVENFYDPEGGQLTIELDPLLTPTQNAQRYYTLYRKADTAEKHLTKLITQGEDDIAYLDSVFDALTRAGSRAELDAIRSELASSGYLRRAAVKKESRAGKVQKLPPLRYRSSDGFTILCGRNNIQNDALTLKQAVKTDLWLHTKVIPGSHVIVLTEGRKVPDTTITQAATIAAYNSKGRDSSKVPVDYAPVKNVRKPSGAKPGMVIYENYRTILVDPDKELVRSLAEK